MAENDIREDALAYHRAYPPGKLGIVATKPLANQRDLALAYSPGVAAASMLIVEDPNEAASVTARGNLVGVISNGTAVLGLGSIGPLASKPVMEGKAVLFKKFAGIDVFDIEVDETDVDRLVDIVAALEPTFGGINLEDISAPQCFEVEAKLRERMSIPVFHDDQHGTAIVLGAAIWNALKVVGKKIEDVRLVTSGAGASALACLDLLVSLGLSRENITVTDRKGVIYTGRVEHLDPYKARYAQDTDARTLADALVGADIFLGLSAPGVVKPAMVKKMAKAPIIMALANPTPEIMPELAREACSDAIIATGRSDYANQVNNVLCFPFLFRGALDVGATTINEEMKVACVKALAELAEAETSEVVQAAFGGQATTFGPEKLIPKPFDPRLIMELAPAVAKAAMDSGVATRPIEDFAQYRERLSQFVFRSGLLVKPLFDGARAAPKRVVYAEGEDERVLQAIQVAIDEGLARPTIIGRRFVVEKRMERLGLSVQIDRDFELIDPHNDPRYREYWTLYHELMARRGVSPDDAREVVRTSATVIAALMLKRNEADALICGATGRYHVHLKHVLDVIGRREGVGDVSALTAMVLANGTYFLADTHVSPSPTTEEIVELALLAADSVRRFGAEPKLALLSHSNFGSSDTESALKMRRATAILQRDYPELQIEGEMHADAALDEGIRMQAYPDTRLKGSANLLIMPTLDASNIALNLTRVLGQGISVGPMLIGVAQPAHVLDTSVTARGIVNMTAFAVVDAQAHEVATAG